MKDAALLHIKTSETAFDLFYFSLVIYDICLSNEIDKPDTLIPSEKDSSVLSYETIENLFYNAKKQGNEEVALSFAQFLLLLSVIDFIAKVLLEPDGEGLILYLQEQFPGLEDDWVNSYLHNAGYIFCTFREQFGELPGLEALLERITNLEGL